MTPHLVRLFAPGSCHELSPGLVISHISALFQHHRRQEPPPVPSSPDGSVAGNTMGLGGDIDTNSLLTAHQKTVIQYATVVVASLSILSCLLSLYWFLVMRRNFRRTLIMLLIISDLFKSFWFMVFPTIFLAVGGINTGDPLCDIGGFFLQAGIESCDVAILMISLHMSLQVFSPTSARFGPDGLYRFRYAVIALWIFLPSLMAGLAFARSGRGSYLLQGAFCSLPVRPFWYRLALSWIPRYLVWIYITITALRIYHHVGSGFSVFARAVDSSTNNTSDTNQSKLSSIDQPQSQSMSPKMRRKSSVAVTNTGMPHARRPSAMAWDHDLDNPSFARMPMQKNKLSRDSLSVDASTMISSAPPSHRAKPSTDLTANPTTNVVDYGAVEILSAPHIEGDTIVRLVSTADATAKSRRRAIRRQTRLLFIYPCVYVIMMIVPFAQHCFNYSDYFAQHPIFAISFITPCCYSAMGLVDCLILCWREKPWTSIPGSDGTFLGSFRFWRFLGATAPAISNKRLEQLSRGISKDDAPMMPLSTFYELPNHNDTSRSGTPCGSMRTLLHTVSRPVMPTRAFSGYSDRAQLAAERAAERLALERMEYARERSGTVQHQQDDVEAGKKDWFDRSDSWIGSEMDDDTEDKGDERRERARRDFGSR